MFWSGKNRIWSGKSQWKVREFCRWLRVATLSFQNLWFQFCNLFIAPLFQSGGYTGFALSFRHSVIQSFRNLSNENYSSHFSQELWGLEDWTLVQRGQWAGILYTGIRLLLLICPFISSLFFLSNFQTLKFFVTLFSGTVRPRRLKLGTHVDSGQMYRVYWNQAAAAYSSLYFFIFLSLKFSNIKMFPYTFLRNCEA